MPVPAVAVAAEWRHAERPVEEAPVAELPDEAEQAAAPPDEEPEAAE